MLLDRNLAYKLRERNPVYRLLERNPAYRLREHNPYIEDLERNPSIEDLERNPSIEDLERNPADMLLERNLAYRLRERNPSIEDLERNPAYRLLERNPAYRLRKRNPSIEAIEDLHDRMILPTARKHPFVLESIHNDAFKEEAHKKNEDGTAAAAESSAGGPSSTRSDQKALMKHCTHEHDLMFKEEQNEEYIGLLVVCDGCQDPVVLGPSYTCIHTDGNRKCVFNLHKSCAERPSKIQHPLHQHPLILLNTFPNMKVRCVCNACNQLCIFRYNCSICNFNLDLKCASNWQTIIENDSHKHQFTVLPKELADLHINCNVCGEYWSGTVYYMCSICQLLVHKECASFPRHITIPGHQHRLKLTWCVEDIYPKEDQLCKVCSESIVKCRAVYCCRECCGYVAHTACAIDDYYWEKENSDTTSRDEAAKLKHFSHQHELILFHDHREVKDDDRIITCEGCIRPITTSSFYTCPINSCRLFLHKICAELPTKMFLPLLQSHPFTLLPRAPSFDGLFQCEMCGIFSQGFAYTSEECALPDGKNVIYLDLQCCIYWWENKALKHDSHVHRLLLNIEWGEVYCSGCRGSLKSIFCFSCKRCDFHLCIPCVELPLTARHRYDDHPLKITYASVKNELGEYYCEICEGTRNQTHWFYYCKDCDFDCHPHCILGRYPHVKLGTTYKHDAHDQHLVALVDKSKSPILNDKRDNILPCEKCKQLCLGLVFECKECNINFHREGCCPATDLASSSKSPEKS